MLHKRSDLNGNEHQRNENGINFNASGTGKCDPRVNEKFSGDEGKAFGIKYENPLMEQRNVTHSSVENVFLISLGGNSFEHLFLFS